MTSAGNPPLLSVGAQPPDVTATGSRPGSRAAAPSGRRPAAPVPRTRMFGLENDFAAASAPPLIALRVITPSPLHLRKTESGVVIVTNRK